MNNQPTECEGPNTGDSLRTTERPGRRLNEVHARSAEGQRPTCPQPKAATNPALVRISAEEASQRRPLFRHTKALGIARLVSVSVMAFGACAPAGLPSEAGDDVPEAPVTATDLAPEEREALCAEVPPHAPDRVQYAMRTFLHHGLDGHLTLRFLSDDMVHLAYALGPAPESPGPLRTSPMVYAQHHPGPSTFDEAPVEGGTAFTTANMTVHIDAFGCVKLVRSDREQSTVCPVDLMHATKGFSMNPEHLAHAYGLGQKFVQRGSADGDWVAHGRFETSDPFGHSFTAFSGGASGQLQFPALYALGKERRDNLAIFFDDVGKHSWDFQGDAWWQVRTNSAAVNLFLISGEDLPALRRQYMNLTGRPPVPPKQAFGFWLSEFGFDNWQEADGHVDRLREAGIPLDGLVLDLQWFGATQQNSPLSQMGSLSWDLENFPDPEARIAAYAAEGIGIIPIEESYVATGLSNFTELNQRQGLAASCSTGEAVTFSNWMGHTGMIDWANTDAAAFWHDTLRRPNLVELGVAGHWTDLGEPERYDSAACYAGEDAPRTHAEMHNLYNFFWLQSIYEGYARHGEARRPFMLSRAGAPGLQRFGATMWSGDVAARLDVLATHHNVALHMSYAGVDYYGTDVGGFWRPALWGFDPGMGRLDSADTNVVPGTEPTEGEMYVQWLANAAWFDIPLRAHVYNCGFAFEDLANCGAGAVFDASPVAAFMSPEQVNSNRENILQRYRLIPYYYSLAHKAFETGDPVIAPLVHYYQHDESVAQIGHERMIGRDMLVGVVARHGERQRDIYLPRGNAPEYWFDFFDHSIHEGGSTLRGEPTAREVSGASVFRLPVFVRAGAILPGQATDSTASEETPNQASEAPLLVDIYAHPSAPESTFELYEDDGATVTCYARDGQDEVRPRYNRRRVRLLQHYAPDHTLRLSLEAAEGTYRASSERPTELRWLLPPDRQVTGVTLSAGDGEDQTMVFTQEGQELRVLLPKRSVFQSQHVAVTTTARSPQ